MKTRSKEEFYQLVLQLQTAGVEQHLVGMLCMSPTRCCDCSEHRPDLSQWVDPNSGLITRTMLDTYFDIRNIEGRTARRQSTWLLDGVEFTVRFDEGTT